MAQQELRSALLQKSLEEACEVPLQFGEIALNILEIAHECASVGNKNVISDAFVAITLVQAAVVSAFEAIDINLKSLKDLEKSKEISRRKNSILEKVSLLSKLDMYR